MDPFPDRPPPSRPIAQRARDWVEWFGVPRLAVAVAGLCVAAVGGYWLLHSPPPTTESRLPYAATNTGSAVDGSSGTTSPVDITTGRGDVVVHVAGAVALPGVYHLDGEGRVIDAIAAAGGVTFDADVDALNLAAALRDGDRVFVPRVGEPMPAVIGPGSSSAGQPMGPINLNIASADELDSLPGVGPSTAAAIVSHRDLYGPFSSVDDLLDVRGIGQGKLEALRGLVTV